VGVLAAKDGRAWGLGAYLRRQGVKTDDCVVVTLDLDKRQAVVVIDAVPASRTVDGALCGVPANGA
jgi:hypothetical protein